MIAKRNTPAAFLVFLEKTMESEEAKQVLDALARKLGGAFMARSNKNRMYALKVAFKFKQRSKSQFGLTCGTRQLLYTYSNKSDVPPEAFGGCVLCKSSKWSRLAETLVGRTIKFKDNTELTVKSLEQLAVELEIGGWL